MNRLHTLYCTVNERGSAINRAIGHSVAWLTLAMVLLTCVNVGTRTIFNTGSVGMQELTVYLHACVIMFANAYTLADKGHVRVDVIYRLLTPKAQAWIDLLGSILLLFPFALVSIIISWQFVSDSWTIRETSADAGGIPGIFLLKTLLLVNGGLLVLQAIADICEHLAALILHNLLIPHNPAAASSQAISQVSD